MRITHFVNQYPKVSHTFIRREIMALERQGFSVQRIALRGWDETLLDTDDIAEQKLTQYVLKNGIFGLLISAFKLLLTRPVRFFKALCMAVRMGVRADRPLPYHIIYLLEACQTALYVAKFKSQHMHAHFGTNSSEIVMLASLLTDLPYSFTVHGPEEFDRPTFLKLKEKIEHAKFVVAISSFGQSQLQRWVDYNQWHKIKVVHCGLEPAFYRVETVPVPEAPRLVCVGRLCEQKGQLLLVEAAKILAGRNVKFELVLAGDGELRSAIERLIADYQLQSFIKITGWISSAQVREHLQASRVMVLPSFAEGLPVVIMEAMSLKRPVISTYIAGIPELIIPNQNGWLVPAGDVGMLADAMQASIAMDSVQLEKMGEAAYLSVIERHDIDTEVKKMADFFKSN
ncbi:MAG TPA: colanic acid biosynthesis glycosyltransferase WcaL [Methylophilaceae bacterium]|nr:colanic acid biosynthesis glycosyltransferase WcaL [Methylophilaceae bacterium]